VSQASTIEWTEATWNPVTGCDRISPGCDHCYAMTLAKRLKGMGQPRYQRDGDPRTSGPGFGLTLHEDKLVEPLRWRKPRVVFVNSMSDLFHKDVPEEFIADVFRIMGQAPAHTFQVLTKRPKRMRRVLEHRRWRDLGYSPQMGGHHHAPIIPGEHRDSDVPLPNVWLGTSIESDDYIWRADHLRATPAAVRFISAEPLLGPLPSLDLTGVDWLIVGGESGTGHRPIDPAWVRDLRDRCQEAGTAFFFKQWGGARPKSNGRELDGRPWDEMPKVAA
jgi:protein gp37